MPLKSEGSGGLDAPAKLGGTFEEFWKVYPRKVGKRNAFTAYTHAIKRGGSGDEIIQGALKYRDSPDRDSAYTAHPATWLNGDRWLDDYAVAPSVRLAPVVSLDERFEDQPEGVTFREWLDRYATPEEREKAKRLGLGNKV
jgi:hypothetical protein